MHDALGTQSTDELQNILTGLCNSVITEEDCKKQIIQHALNVSCGEELNDVMSKITGDFSPEKKVMIQHRNQMENISKKMRKIF